MSKPSMVVAYNMKRRKKCHGMAEGGAIGETADKTSESGYEKGVHKKDRGPLTGLHKTYSTAGKDARVAHEYSQDRPRTYGEEREQGQRVSEYTGKAKEAHKRVLSEMRADKGDRKNLAHGGSVYPYSEEEKCGNEISGPAMKTKFGMADGGMAEDDYEEEMGHDNDMDQGYQTGDKELDMIGRIMAHREKMSQGGKVANDDLPKADFMPNEFDALHLEDDLSDESSAGNEMSDDQEDEDQSDMVSRIMKSRKKKPGHNPRPA